MYTNKTTHYEIPLPLGSDLTTPMDYNDSMEAIDAAIFQAAGDADTANDNAAAAVETANQAAGDVTTLGGRVNDVESTQTTQANAIVALTNATNSLSTQVQNKFNSVSVADAYSPSGIYSVGDKVTYQGNLYVCNTAITTGEPFDADKWTATDVVSLIGTPGQTVEASDVDYVDTVTELGATNVQAAIVALKQLIDNIGGGNMIPDYSQKSSFTSGSTTASDGIFIIEAMNATSFKVTIDGSEFNSQLLASNSGSGYGFMPSNWFPVKSGSVITYNAGNGYFMPYVS